MSKAKVKSTQEVHDEVTPKIKKTTKHEAKEVHATKVEGTQVSKKKKTGVQTATPVVETEVVPTEKIVKRRTKKSTLVDTETTPVEVEQPIETVESEKKKTTKTEKQSKLLQQVLSVDRNGLSIIPIRVRRMLLDVVFNRRNRSAEKELTANKDALLEASNLKEGYLSFHGFSQETLAYLRTLLVSHLETERAKYERKKVKALVDSSPKDTNGKPVISAKLQELLNSTRQVLRTNTGSVTTLYQQYDKKFYKEFTEAERIYNLTGTDGYKFYRSLISRDKIRLNLSGNLRLTAFVELVFRHLVSQACTACVANQKTTVNISTMTGSQATDTYLAQVATNSTTWVNALTWLQNGRVLVSATGEDGKKTVPQFVDVEQLNPGNKFKFNSYLVDLCKNVNRSLLTNTTGTSYADVKISGEFKTLCGELFLELIHTIGNLLRVIMSTGRDRTVTTTTVDALIQLYHLTLNLSDNTASTLTAVDGLVGTYNTAQTTLRENKAKQTTVTA